MQSRPFKTVYILQRKKKSKLPDYEWDTYEARLERYQNNSFLRHFEVEVDLDWDSYESRLERYMIHKQHYQTPK